MDQNYLKTSWKQRLSIIAIAILLLGITVATYIGLVISNNASKSSSSSTDTSKTDEIYQRYTAKSEELNTLSTSIAPTYFEEFKGYKSNVKAYNEESANGSGLQTEDIKVGDGTEVTSEWQDYFAYYIGYCADESVFDSSFDSYENPTTLKAPISGNQSLIAGWSQGVLGMKVGGVRQITMPGELAYGETREICGGTNKPLRSIIMAIEPGEDYRKLNSELNDIIAEYSAAASASN